MAYMSAPWRVKSVTVTGPWRLNVVFSDGVSGDADLGWLEERDGVFLPLRDSAFFAQVFVDPATHTAAWPNGADIAPDTLRYLVTGESVKIGQPPGRRP